MNIYIAYNYNKEPLSVLLADSKEKANLVWMGMSLQAHSVEEINPNSDLGVNGAAILLTSTERSSHKFSHRNGGFKFRQWKRGG